MQKNAANAEEAAAASEEMSAQAEQMNGFVKDLMFLVGGNGNGNGLVSIGDNHPTRISQGQMSSFPQNQKNGITMGLNAFNRKENSKGTGGVIAAAHRRSKEILPHQVIPLDEGDFKEF